MTYVLPLIDKTDGFETVRDAVVSLLATETALQQALATAAAEDPALWEFDVFSERSNPWERFDADPTAVPAVNVWYDSSQFDESASNTATRQLARPSRYNVDVYASAVTAEAGAGHDLGDVKAAKEAHRVTRLVRNLLMHDKYIALGLSSKLVSRRWIESITAFQPQSGNVPVSHVRACRLVLAVDHLETVDLPDHETIDIVNVKFHYEPDGQVIAELHYE